MRKSLVMLGLPLAAGLSLTLASCGGPAVEQEEEGLQQPGAAPTQIDEDEDEDEDNVPGAVNNQDNDGNEETDGGNE